MGLLVALAMLRQCGCAVALMDALEQTWCDVPWPRPRPDGRGPYPKTEVPKPNILQAVPRRFCRYGHDPARVEAALSALAPPPELVLITSLMTYWYPGVTEAVALCRRLWPKVPIAVGGIYPTLCPEHARHLEADLLVAGPLEKPSNWAALWGLMGTTPPPLPEHAGFVFAHDLYSFPDFGVVLGSRGCPYACAYCASRILSPGFRQAPAQVVLHSLAQLYHQGLRHIAFADDALLVRPETWLWEALDFCAHHGLTMHTPNAVHVRALTPAVCRRLWRGGVRTLRLGLETLDFSHRLDVKLTLAEWDQAAAAVREAGFGPEQIRAYVLFGLPDQDDDALMATIMAAGRRGIPVELAFYSPIPGTVLFSAAQHASPWPLAEEPLTHNSSIWPCRPGGFSWSEAARWKALVRQALHP